MNNRLCRKIKEGAGAVAQPLKLLPAVPDHTHALDGVPVITVLIQLTAKGLGKQRRRKCLSPCTDVRDRKEAPG